MNFTTTTEILEFSKKFGTPSESVELVKIINSHLETGFFTGEARQELLNAKHNAHCWRGLQVGIRG